MSHVRGLSPDAYGFGHGDPDRHLGLVVSVLAARVLPRGAPARGVPRLLRRTVRHGRAQLDRLPPAERRPVPALGRRGAGRLRVRRQVLADAPRPGDDVSRARRGARRPPGASARGRRGAARRRDALLRRGVGTGRDAARLGPPPRVVGRRRRLRPRRRPRRRAVPLPAPARAAVHRRRAAGGRGRRSATRPTSTCATRTRRPRRRSSSVCVVFSRRVWSQTLPSAICLVALRRCARLRRRSRRTRVLRPGSLGSCS